MEKDHVSNMLPNNFEEKVIRVFIKKDDFEFFGKVNKHFNDWCSQNGLKLIYGMNTLNLSHKYSKPISLNEPLRKLRQE